MHRAIRRTLAGTIVGLAVAGALVAPASAHVTVSPREATKGDFAKVTFRVPNERANAGTTKVEIAFPTEQPVAFVSVRPQAGWTYTVEKVKPPKPITAEGTSVAEVVSRITWVGGPIKSGEFQEFDVSLGPLPEAGLLEFKALQTYDNGDVVRWIDSVPGSGGAEPEHPAPVLKLIDPVSQKATATSAPARRATIDYDEDSAETRATIGLALGGLALVVALVALVRSRKRD